jgi:hypothetical protein
MRSLVFLAATALGVAVASFACSSDKAAATDDAGAPTPSTTDTTSGGPPPASSTEVPDPTPKDASTITPTDGSSTTDGSSSGNTGGGDGGTQCAAGSVAESEDNNSAANADSIEAKTGSYCGQVGPSDQDHVKFIMPQSLSGEWRLRLTTDQKFSPKLEVSVDGGAFQDTEGATIEFAGGKPYVFRVSSTAGAGSYRLEFTFP